MLTLELETEKTLSYIQPNWPAPPHVKAYQTTRQIGTNIKDISPRWLNQVHGNRVVDIATEHLNNPEADASFSTKPNVACAIKTADCLPILICDRVGTVVAAIHAGWRSLLAGIIEVTIAALPVENKELLVWLGPAIGPDKFEVGEDVYSLFITYDLDAKACFIPQGSGKWLANLYQLAKQRLLNCGIKETYGGDYCTYSQKDLFFSYRRHAGETGRMASLIWLERKIYS